VKLSIHPYFLEFIRPFKLAHGTRSGTQLAFIKIEFQGIIAFGEASIPPYYKETFNSINNWVQDQEQNLAKILLSNPIDNPESIPYSSDNPAASAALQTAILNWHACAKKKSLIDFFPQNNTKTDLALTITKNDVDFLDEKLLLETNFTHLKLKLTGNSDDLEFVKLIRRKSDLDFCIDINQGCQNKEAAIKLIAALENLQCKLIEQPLHKTDHDGHLWLKKRTKLPIIADESIGIYEELIQYHEAYSGVNIKLMKCGGLIQAQKMLQFNPQRSITSDDSEFMHLLGCMSESTLGISTSAVLASQCCLADLDAPYLNKNDPFIGFRIKNKKIELDNCIELNDNTLFA